VSTAIHAALDWEYSLARIRNTKIWDSALVATRLLGINEKKVLLTPSNLIAPIHGYIYPQNVGRKLENSPSPRSLLLPCLKIRIMAVPTPGDTVIAVMGITGVGKSTFIANATGQDVRIGHGLASCQYYAPKRNSQTHKPQAPKSPRYSRARLTAAKYSLSIPLDLMIVACATMPISWR
jgi:hypothetical protein